MLCTMMTSTYGHNDFSVDCSFRPADTFADSQFRTIRRERQAARRANSPVYRITQRRIVDGATATPNSAAMDVRSR
jgi:hypothetical protein